MHPDILQILAAERVRDMRRWAPVIRYGRAARRARPVLDRAGKTGGPDAAARN
jgi:hypothetical protein